MSNKTSDKNVVTEEDIRVINKIISFYKNIDILYNKEIQALERVLAEREQKDKRIQELEEALLKVKDKNTTLFITCRNSIPKQAVTNALNRHKFAYEELGKTLETKQYENEELKKFDFNLRITEDRIVQVLQELLEGGRLGE